jgi:hypothetical protein
MGFIFGALFLLVVLVGPAYHAAKLVQKTVSSRGVVFMAGYATYILWCALFTAAFFVIPNWGLYFVIYYQLVPVVPVAMVIGLGVLFRVLSRLVTAKKGFSLVDIVLAIISALILFYYLYPQSIPVPDSILQQKADFEDQIRESGGTVTP